MMRGGVTRILCRALASSGIREKGFSIRSSRALCISIENDRTLKLASDLPTWDIFVSENRYKL